MLKKTAFPLMCDAKSVGIILSAQARTEEDLMHTLTEGTAARGCCLRAGSRGLGFAVLLWLALAASVHAQVPGTVTRLSTGSATSSQTAPAISGTRVVWTDRTLLPGGGFNSEIFFVDVSTTDPPRNVTNTQNEQEYLPDVDGTTVVYTHSGSGMPGDIIAYDVVASSAQTVAASDSLVTYSLPAIDGRYVVYVRNVNSPTGAQVDIDGYDLTFGSPIGPVTNDPAIQSHPRVSGDLVVFEDYASGGADIHGWRVGAAAPFLIAQRASQPDADGSWVVWLEFSGELFIPNVVAAVNVESGVKQLLSSTSSEKIQPRISGARVVWADNRSGDFDLWSYDLASGVEEVLVDGIGEQVLADIDGDRVVYSSNERGFEEIYLFEISPPANAPPIADAGPDQRVMQGDRVTLDGTASRDPEGNALAYQWTQVRGPSVVLSDPTVQRPRFTAPLVRAGRRGETLVFQLVVSDGAASSAPDFTKVFVRRFIP